MGVVLVVKKLYLLWVYFMGVPSTVPRSGKPGWPTDGDEACGPSGGPVAVDREGRSPAQDQQAGSAPT